MFPPRIGNTSRDPRAGMLQDLPGSSLVGAMRGAGPGLSGSMLPAAAAAAVVLCALAWPGTTLAQDGAVALPEIKVIGTTPLSTPRAAPRSSDGGERRIT